MSLLVSRLSISPFRLLSPTTHLAIQSRSKMVRCQAYQRPGTSAPYGQSPEDRAHLGVRALAAEYVEAGQLLVKQRRYLSKNISVTRRKHFKYYPGQNVRVRWTTSLATTTAGRVKFTHDVHRDVIFVNVLPEPREELLRSELWRYRTEHVTDGLHNQELCLLRSKALPHFPRPLVNPPTGAKPDKDRVGGRLAAWNNPVVRDPVEIEPYPFALKGDLLKKHLRGEVVVVDRGYALQASDAAQH